jgi:SAM-dependent methyltransferase
MSDRFEQVDSVRDTIIDTEYNRERLAPEPGDPLYLHLSDLRLAMDSIKSDQSIRLLDYGCGGSPYRKLFPHADYRRADFLVSPGLDYVVGEDSCVDEVGGSFDFILSTQVLEHVSSPSSYLSEAYRLLRDGGELICTTHGVYEEHGCPYDFWRWTGYGLAKACEEVGFSVDQTLRLTTGPRAVLFLSEMYRTRFGSLPNNNLGQSLYVFLNTVHTDTAGFHRWCDEAYKDFRLTSSTERDHAFSIALLVRARKPASTKVKPFIFRPNFF